MNERRLDNLIDAIGSLNDYLVLESMEKSPQMKEQKMLKWVTSAASVVLVIAAGVFALFLSGGFSSWITPTTNPSETTEAPAVINDVLVSSFSSLGSGTSDLNSILPDALNSDTSSDSYPVFGIYTLDDRKDFRLYAERHGMHGTFYDLEKFDDAFFEHNSLYIVNVPCIASDISAVSAVISDGRLKITLKADPPGEPGIGSWLVYVTTSKLSPDEVKYADAYLTEDYIREDEITPDMFSADIVEIPGYSYIPRMPDLYEITAVNDWKLYENGIHPIFELHSTHELRLFRDESMRGSFEEFDAAVKEYTDEFFIENTLYVSLVTSDSYTYEWSISGISVSNGILNLNLDCYVPKDALFGDIKSVSFCIFVTVPDRVSSRIAYADCMTNVIFESSGSSPVAEDFATRESIIKAGIGSVESKLTENEIMWAKLYAEAHYPDKTVTDVRRIDIQGLWHSGYSDSIDYLNVFFSDNTELPLVLHLLYSRLPVEKYYLSGIEVRERIGTYRYSPEYIEYVTADPRYEGELTSYPGTTYGIECGDGISVYRLDIDAILDELCGREAAIDAISDRVDIFKPYNTIHYISPHLESFDGSTLTLCVETEELLSYTEWPDSYHPAYHVEYDLKTGGFSAITMTDGEHFMFHWNENLSLDRKYYGRVTDDNKIVIMKGNEVYDALDDLADVGKYAYRYCDFIVSDSETFNDRYIVMRINSDGSSEAVFWVYSIEKKTVILKIRGEYPVIKGDRIYYKIYDDVPEADAFLAYVDLSEGETPGEHRLDGSIAANDSFFTADISEDGRYILRSTKYSSSDGISEFFAYDVETGEKFASYLTAEGLPFYNNYYDNEYNADGRWALYMQGHLFVFEYAECME